MFFNRYRAKQAQDTILCQKAKGIIYPIYFNSMLIVRKQSPNSWK